MTSRTIKRLHGNQFIAVDSHDCKTCAGCGVRRTSVQLEGVSGNKLRLEIEPAALIGILANSLLLPTLLLVLVAMTCSVLSVAESHAVIASVIAFVCGVVFCQEKPATLINLDEVK